MRTRTRFNRSAIESKIERLASYLQIEDGFDGFCQFIDDINGQLGIPKTLTELGVTNPDIDRLVRDVIADPSCGGNPVKLAPENTRALLLSCL